MNKHLTGAEVLNNLKEYLRTNRDYAVMIDSDWGTGKTYFWGNSILPTIQSEFPAMTPVYLSLYGLTAKEAIRALGVKMLLNKASFKWRGSFTSSAIWDALAVFLLGGSIAIFLCLAATFKILEHQQSVGLLMAQGWQYILAIKSFVWENSAFSVFASTMLLAGLLLKYKNTAGKSTPELENGMVSYLASLDWKWTPTEKTILNSFKHFHNMVVCLDDLERASVDSDSKLQDHLALINRLAEHYGIHVICLCNSKPIIESKQEEFEKCFRHIWSFQPDISEIWRDIIVDNAPSGNAPLKRFLERSTEEMKCFIHDLSAQKDERTYFNLRILHFASHVFFKICANDKWKLLDDNECHPIFRHLFKLCYAQSFLTQTSGHQFDLSELREFTDPKSGLNAWVSSAKDDIKKEERPFYRMKMVFHLNEFDERIYIPHWDADIELLCAGCSGRYDQIYAAFFPWIFVDKSALQQAISFLTSWKMVWESELSDFQEKYDIVIRALESGAIYKHKTFCDLLINLWQYAKEGIPSDSSMEQVKKTFRKAAGFIDDPELKKQHRYMLKFTERPYSHCGDQELLEFGLALNNVIFAKNCGDADHESQIDIINAFAQTSSFPNEELLDKYVRGGKPCQCIFNDETYAKTLTILNGGSNKRISEILHFLQTRSYSKKHDYRTDSDYLLEANFMLRLMKELKEMKSDCNDPIKRLSYTIFLNTMDEYLKSATPNES